jgi:hypothetical protein
MSNKIVFASALVAALSLLAQPGAARGPTPVHQGPWPIHDGFNHQPTQNELRVLNHQDVTPDGAREVDRLYDQLMSDSEKVLGDIPHRDINRTRIGISSKNRLLSSVPTPSRPLTQSLRGPSLAPKRAVADPDPDEGCLWGLKRYNGVSCP